ncbi:unnamed protein product [Mytilus coruscus]|uniref:SWIM-type domain-containing protein n=1 Tax=Mytilus coruscus TaxID=42192 RepID=A0A6J8B4A9_MYTCO|nr:unnamed protein product [Mytilus coruscus]
MKFIPVLDIFFLTYLNVYTKQQNENLIEHKFSKINIYCRENLVKNEVSARSHLQCASKCLPLLNQYCKAFVWNEIGKTCTTNGEIIMHDIATPSKLDVYIAYKDGCTNKGYYYDLYSNTCLNIFADKKGKTWSDARNHCQENGGDLISLTTPAKWEFVSNFTSCRTNMWIGLKDEIWVTNATFKNVFNVTIDFNKHDSDYVNDTEPFCGKFAYTSNVAVLQDESCNLRLKNIYSRDPASYKQSMASTQSYQKVTLTSDDVPGAKINFDDLDNYGNVQLKRWLECRGLKTGGNKSDLVQRCKDAVKAGKSEDIDIAIDGGKWCDVKAAKTKKDPSLSLQLLIPPVLGWKPFPSRQIPANFNYGHIYHYLLESVVMEGENGQTEDTDLGHLTSKPLTKGQQYVKSGSVSNIMDNERNHHYFVKAKVAASMRNEERIVQVTLSCLSGAVRDASCTCPGSALGRCNHVAAVLLTVDKHCKEFGHDQLACTSKQCEWGKGQKKKKKKNPGKIRCFIYILQTKTSEAYRV